MTPEYVIQFLCQKMGDDKHSYGIEWRENPQGGFLATVNGVALRLHNAFNFQGTWKMLTLSKGGKETSIEEPLISHPNTPLGKFSKAMRQFFGMKGSQGQTTAQNKKAQRAEQLHVSLNKLWYHAARQCALRHTPENQEAIRQELFRTVTLQSKT